MHENYWINGAHEITVSKLAEKTTNLAHVHAVHMDKKESVVEMHIDESHLLSFGALQ